MIIRFAEDNELEIWKKLAKDVAEIFGNPKMDTDPEFIDYAQRKILQKEALIAVDNLNNEFYGIIGFFRKYNRITWFGVFEKYRDKGIGSKLLKRALNELDKTKEITVETYRENFLSGQPARKIYEKFGFKETDTNLFDSFGNERSKYAFLI